MEQVRNRIDVRLLGNEKERFEMNMKTNLNVTKIFDHDLVVISKIKVTLKLKKFHYDYIKNKHGNTSRLLFTDIDNLMCEIETRENHQDVLSSKYKTLLVENHYKLLIIFNIDNRLKTSDLKSVNNL